MSSLELKTKLLAEFGLTGNQAKVYLTILQLRSPSVGKISRVSRVRREDVYRILPKLEKMGLIEKALGKPFKIKTIPVGDALAMMIKLEQEKASRKLSALAARKDEFLRYIGTDRGRTMSDGEDIHFSLLPQREAILSRGTAMINNAQKEIDITYPSNKLEQLMYAYAEPLGKAAKKGVRIRAITEIPRSEEEIPKLREKLRENSVPFDLRYADTLSFNFLSVDEQQTLFSTILDWPMGEHAHLWTDNVAFVGLIQKSFEDLWNDSVDWRVIDADSIMERAEYFVSQLRPGDHVMFVYKTQEAKHSVLFRYLKNGLDKGEAAMYLCGEEASNKIRKAMKRYGINVEDYEKTGALRLLSLEDFFMPKKEFNVPKTLGWRDALYAEALQKGFKGLRVVGEAAWFFRHNLIPELVETERATYRVFESPMTWICAYNADALTRTGNPVNLYAELVKAHGAVLFAETSKNVRRCGT